MFRSAPVSKQPNKDTQTKPAPKPGEPVPKAASEARFLAQQAVDARAAITRTLSQLGTDIGNGVGPGALTRKHPWLTLGACTAAGFVAAAVLVPSRHNRALRKLARIERLLNPAPKSETNGQAPAGGAKGYKSGTSSFARSLLTEVLKTVQPALLSMLTAGVTASAARPSQDEMQAAAAAEDRKNTPQT
jgi:hypothetical protein